jgi:hypothetical protein
MGKVDRPLFVAQLALYVNQKGRVVMRKIMIILALVLCFSLLSACTGMNSNDPNASADSSTPVQMTYIAEFSDIPIPMDMKEVKKYTFVILNQDGSKSGCQVYEGNVDVQSLMNAMLYTMTQQGWVARGVFRGPRCSMTLDKGNSIAIITANEETFTTRMEVWVAKKMIDGAVVPSQPESQLPPVIEGNPL